MLLVTLNETEAMTIVDDTTEGIVVGKTGCEPADERYLELS